MPVKRQASDTRMLMGSIASGDDGGEAGDWKGMKAPSLNNRDGTAGRASPRRARLSRFVLLHSIRRLYADACFSAPGYHNSVRWTLWVLSGRLSIRKYRHAFLDARGASRGRGYRPEVESIGRLDTGSALRTQALPIRRSRPFSSAIFASDESAMRSLEKWQITVTLRKRGSGVV